MTSTRAPGSWRSDSPLLPARLCPIAASGAALTVVMAAMAVLWLIATIHDSLLAKTGLPQQPARHGPRPAGAH